jgi:hypothetical protein
MFVTRERLYAHSVYLIGQNRGFPHHICRIFQTRPHLAELSPNRLCCFLCSYICNAVGVSPIEERLLNGGLEWSECERSGRGLTEILFWHLCVWTLKFHISLHDNHCPNPDLNWASGASSVHQPVVFWKMNWKVRNFPLYLRCRNRPSWNIYKPFKDWD